MRTPRPVAALALVLLCAACSGQADAEPQGGETPSPPAAVELTEGALAAPDSSAPTLIGPGGEVIAVTDVDILSPEALAPAPVAVSRTLDYVAGEDATITVRAVSPDGRVLVSSADDSDFDGGTLTFTATDTVSLWVAEGLEPLGSTDALLPEEPHRQVIDATFTDGGVVWAETSRANVSVWEWRLFGHGLDGGDPHLLARSEDLRPATDQTFGSGGALLAAAGDRVAWDVTYERQDGALRTDLVSVPVTGGQPRTEAELAAMPAGAQDGWVTLRLAPATDDGVGRAGDHAAPYRAEGIDLVAPGGQVEPLVRFAAGEDDWAVTRLAADGHLYSWATTDEVYVAGVDGAAVHRLRHGPGRSVDPYSLAVCGDRVVWAVTETASETATIHVFDPGTARAHVLPTEGATGELMCGGPHIAWTQADVSGGREVRTLSLAHLG